jgi:hypothetical protein
VGEVLVDGSSSVLEIEELGKSLKLGVFKFMFNN